MMDDKFYSKPCEINREKKKKKCKAAVDSLQL